MREIYSLKLISLIFAGSLLVLSGCATYTTRVNNASGSPTVYNDPSTAGPVSGIGIESQDVVSMTDKMARDILASPVLINQASAQHVIIDAEYFKNEGSSKINKNLIIDRLRTELNRAASGKLVFIGRHYADMVDNEKTLKKEEVVSSGNKKNSSATLGGDYRLGGRITTIDSVDTSTGQVSRFHQIVFEMVDLETEEIVWSGVYSFKKSASDDIVYR